MAPVNAYDGQDISSKLKDQTPIPRQNSKTLLSTDWPHTDALRATRLFDLFTFESCPIFLVQIYLRVGPQSSTLASPDRGLTGMQPNLTSARHQPPL